MFGKNPILKQDLTNGNVLHVCNGSPFYTIQGEGPFAGHPAVFIRLHGCMLRCTFCDTNFSDPTDKRIRFETLADEARRVGGHAGLAVLTGGEPMRQNIIPLITALIMRGFKVQIETAGVYWIDGINHLATIICSPKTPQIHSEIFNHARAFKYVISAKMDFDDNSEYPYVPITATQPGARAAQLATPRPNAEIYLSPCDEYDEKQNNTNKRLVVALAKHYGVIAGCQLHKVLEVEEPQ